MKYFFIITIVAAFLALVHAFYYQYKVDETWRTYQRAYLTRYDELVKETGGALAPLTDPALRRTGVKQMYLQTFGRTRVDRCRSCHAAIDNVYFAGDENPLKSHPLIKEGEWLGAHKFDEFGCTICHDGEGRELQVLTYRGVRLNYAHGDHLHSTHPLLGRIAVRPPDQLEDGHSTYQPVAWQPFDKDFLEARCVQCHVVAGRGAEADVVDKVPHLLHGRRLYFEKACWGCHQIRGLSEGKVGPSLTDVGAKWKYDYLAASIRVPTANLDTSVMPQFLLTDDEVKGLLIFLMSNTGTRLSASAVAAYRERNVHASTTAEPVEQTPEHGKRLMIEKGCAACHRLPDSDGEQCPDLRDEALKRDRAYLDTFIHDPKETNPDTIMPVFLTSDSERGAIITYVLTMRDAVDGADPVAVFKERCARCHGEDGMGDGMIAKNLYPRPKAIANAVFINGYPTERFVASITDGLPGTAMPPWGKIYTEAQIRAILDYVRTTLVQGEPKIYDPSRVIREVSGEGKVPYSDESVQRGRATFVQRCTGCHGPAANGKGETAKDQYWRPANLTNKKYIGSLSDERLFTSISMGVRGTAMPSWAQDLADPKTRWDLVNYIRSISGGPPKRGE